MPVPSRRPRTGTGARRRAVQPRRARTAPAAPHTPYRTNEIVVTYGLTGMLDPIDSMIPPTTDTVANTTLSTGASTGDAVTRTAAAAGVQSSASTSSAPTTCTDTATARPSTSMNSRDSARTGTPRDERVQQDARVGGQRLRDPHPRPGQAGTLQRGHGTLPKMKTVFIAKWHGRSRFVRLGLVQARC